MKGISCVLVALLFVAFICDMKTDKVPNKLILSGYGIGVVNFVLRYGPFGILFAVAAVLAVLLCLIPVYRIGGLGGGDCKMLAWMVLFLEPEMLPECYFFIFLCGGIIAIIKIVLKKGRTFHFTIAALFGVMMFLLKVHIMGKGGEL